MKDLHIFRSIGVIFFKDVQGRNLVINRAFEELFGISQRDIVGKTDGEFLPQDLAQYCKKSDEQVLINRKAMRFEELSTSKDGKKIFFETIKTPLWDNVGNIMGLVGVSRNITERKQAEEGLQKSEEKYRTILETIEEGYFEIDLAGNFTFVNDREASFLGYSKKELIGMNNRQYTDQETSQKLYQVFSRIYITGEPAKKLDIEVIKKDGTKGFVEIWVYLVKDSTGQPTGFRGIARDITERMRAEEEVATLQEQLRQAQKMEAVGQLAGGIAHDFNNLLTVIRGYSDLLLASINENNPLYPDTLEIRQASERAESLTRQLLAFSRRQVIQPKVLKANDLVANMDKMLRRLLGENIELVTFLDEDLGAIKADPGQIEQVIINLSVNARDAMRNGGKLTIETSNMELDEAYARTHINVSPGNYVMLSVSDTGIGMPPEIKERIFEPFFTTREKDKGTGLGLSTVYGIVKQSGGNIWVYSEPGKGTTFKIYLPRIEEGVESKGVEDACQKAPQGFETILVVEDEEVVRRVTATILQKKGYSVLEATNAEEALSLVRERNGKPIHLMLTDVVMPGMHGPELAKNLSSLHPEMKVVYMSGYPDNAIVYHEILRPGMPYLQKPFTSDGLVRKVRKVLDERQ